MIDRAYKWTSTGSPLRKLLVDMHVNHGQRDWIEKGMNADFLADLVRDLLDIRNLLVSRTPQGQTLAAVPTTITVMTVSATVFRLSKSRLFILGQDLQLTFPLSAFCATR